MPAEQLPSAAAYTVGGQSTIADHIVVSEVDGFTEDGETKMLATGQFGCDIVYSRRKTKTVVLELLTGASQTGYLEGGHVDATFAPGGTAAWEIKSVQRVNTRGPVQITLELVSITEDITA